MEILDNPILLVASLVLSALSFILLTAGLKLRNMNWALWGVALGVPSYAPGEPLFWCMGAVIGFLAHRARHI